MVDVTVKIPEDRLPAFYEWLGRWLAGRIEAIPVVPQTDVESEAALKPWNPEDVELARKVWHKLSDPAKRMFEVLMAQPAQPVSAEELAAGAQLRDHFAVAGTLAWPGRHCYAVGREFAIRWSSVDGSKYWIEPVVADLFRLAKEGDVGR